MIDLTAKPEKFSSVYRPVIYTLTKTGTDKESVQILDGSTVLGMKQFTSEGQIAVNVSEYYRGRIDTQPVIDDSLAFIHAAKRTVRARIDTVADSSVLLTSGIAAQNLSALLSNAPETRILRPGQWDELSYLVDEQVLSGAIIVKMSGGQQTALQIPNTSIDGVAVLVVHYDSIAEAVQLKGFDPLEMNAILVKPTLGCYEMPQVEYRIAPAGEGVRIAWWNRQGGIDAFTFQSDLDKSYYTERTKIKTQQGWRTVSSEVEDERNIVSGRQPQAVMEWLGEIVSSPKVWLVEAGKIVPIDITSEDVVVYDMEALAQLELTFRSIDSQKMQTL